MFRMDIYPVVHQPELLMKNKEVHLINDSNQSNRKMGLETQCGQKQPKIFLLQPENFSLEFLFEIFLTACRSVEENALISVLVTTHRPRASLKHNLFPVIYIHVFMLVPDVVCGRTGGAAVEFSCLPAERISELFVFSCGQEKG
uniref:Uncharacterized protein n=2 Tax=Nothobranchius kadleci TaxID=1051664 RepID=A0A1A8BYH5_NOTKA